MSLWLCSPKIIWQRFNVHHNHTINQLLLNSRQISRSSHLGAVSAFRSFTHTTNTTAGDYQSLHRGLHHLTTTIHCCSAVVPRAGSCLNRWVAKTFGVWLAMLVACCCKRVSVLLLRAGMINNSCRQQLLPAADSSCCYMQCKTAQQQSICDS